MLGDNKPSKHSELFTLSSVLGGRGEASPEEMISLRDLSSSVVLIGAMGIGIGRVLSSRSFL
jgi:hypothetical protein